MTNLDGSPESQHPRPEHIPDVEYEDEPPGSYLGEFRIGWWKFAGSALNVLVAALIPRCLLDREWQRHPLYR